METAKYKAIILKHTLRKIHNNYMPVFSFGYQDSNLT